MHRGTTAYDACAATPASGESGLGGLGDAVQLEVELDVRARPQLLELGFELGDPAAQSSDLEK
ncbi:MAG: hypothetical protein QOG80_1269 [Pseudonocardiales bacterium]|nr:hypothetical protein [Pseudonocardiales bacterium]